MEKKKNELGIEDYFIFLTFQTISKIKNSKISLSAVHTVLCIFEEDFIIRKMKKYQFSWPFSFFLYLKIYKYDKAK